MPGKLLHTPEGVRDIYNDECEAKRALEKILDETAALYGYRPIETPSFEYFDVFGSDIGTTPSNELYKFFDREGNTLALRPDFTPAVARAASKYLLDDENPIRVCYRGNTFVNQTSFQGRLNETTQMGVELMGDEGVDADAEVIALSIECLLRAGIDAMQVSVGHAGFFEALIKEAGLDEDTSTLLRELIINRNIFGAERLLSGKDIDPAIRDLLSALPSLTGSVDMLQRLLEKGCPGEASPCVERLLMLWDSLGAYNMQRYITFDLGMMSQYMYYTGIIFRGYTYGVGDAVVKGGRYDELLSCFNRKAPAIGFVIAADQLMSALSRQKNRPFERPEKTLVLAESGRREEGIRKAMSLREKGIITELRILSDTQCAGDIKEKAEKGGAYKEIVVIKA